MSLVPWKTIEHYRDVLDDSDYLDKYYIMFGIKIIKETKGL